MSVLELLARHNQWANQQIFAACASLPAEKLTDTDEGYASVLAILEHLIQVEHAFFELAHGREPRKILLDTLEELRSECVEIDKSYVDYATGLDPTNADAKTFLIPWFGFEISLTEGIVQPLTHSHKHRADVSMLLPRLGGEGLEMDLIQWLAEERSAR